MTWRRDDKEEPTAPSRVSGVALAVSHNAGGLDLGCKNKRQHPNPQPHQLQTRLTMQGTAWILTLS